MSIDPAELRERLANYLRNKTGYPHASVHDLTPLPGHAGISYRFIHEPHGGGKSGAERLVLRLAPAGAPAAGPNDVVRQARIIAAIGAAAPIAVAPIRWYDNDSRWFGAPFFIADFVDGEKPVLGDRVFEPAEMRQCARSAIEAMAALHRLDWRAYARVFGEQATPSGELDRLARLLDRPTLDQTLIRRAPALGARLAASIPARIRLGCVHGDFNWSNCLFRDGELAALIDWELAQIGAVMLDLGWICLFSDRLSWTTGDLTPACGPEPEELAAMYEECTQTAIYPTGLRWFRAFSGYRFGAITAFNLMLHRRGKRHDPMWETIAESAPRLFERGLELIG
ncbi:MAG: phosphotransferase family protein [Candidatus Binataceae bacterium]